MAEHPINTTEPNTLNGASKQQATPKKTRRNHLPTAVQSSTSRTEITLKATVSSTPKSVAADSFPLYRLFSLDSTGTGEIYVKVSKVRIVNISTGDVYNSQVSGYLLSI